jgi:dihydrofolate reductase
VYALPTARTIRAAAIADNTNQKEEQTMIIYEDLMKAVQDDARRAGERDRLLLEARRARRAHRQRLVPAAPARRRTEMGKIVVSENVALDGVIQDPTGDEGFRAGGWFGLIGNSPQLAKLALDEALAAGAFLLGRRSYEWLAARCPSRSGELADRLNSLPKYVVSATLANPAWNNSTVLKGDVLNEVSRLKQHHNIATTTRHYARDAARSWPPWRSARLDHSGHHATMPGPERHARGRRPGARHATIKARRSRKAGG